MHRIWLVALLLFVNILGGWFYFRWDLTEDKRYTLSPFTKALASNLPQPVHVEVFLDGDDLPGGFQRLKIATKELMDEIQNEAGSDLFSYSFLDPREQAPAFLDTLLSMGVQPTNIFDSKGGQRTETLAFPYARLRAGGRQEIIPLLKANKALNAQEKLNQSGENLEFAFSKALRNFSGLVLPKVGLLSEFTRLKPVNFAGLIQTLQQNYELYILDTKATESFAGLDAIILPKPDYPVDDSTKFKIDQFIMHGGKALFFVDGLRIDSIGLEGTFAQPLELGLDDLFFKYGVRLNKDLVKDGVSCAAIPMVVGNQGEQANIQPVPYRYFPLINNFGESLITKNLDMVFARFASTLDSLPLKGVTKTPLLSTTAFTKVLQAPALVTYNDGRKETDKQEFRQGVKHLSYLLEGRFPSLFQNRILPGDPRMEYFLGVSQPTKILVCSDGDIIVNDVDRKTGEPLPLGMDKVSGNVYGNEDFLTNAMAYLLDEQGLISVRGKEIILRPLDPVKVREERTLIQLKAILIPVVLVIISGVILWGLRKKKYA